MRATPPSARMSAGTRSSAMTATAPASSAIFACSALTTSMMTPPLSISARPVLTRRVPTSLLVSDTCNYSFRHCDQVDRVYRIIGVRVGVRLYPPPSCAYNQCNGAESPSGRQTGRARTPAPSQVYFIVMFTLSGMTWNHVVPGVSLMGVPSAAVKRGGAVLSAFQVPSKRWPFRNTDTRPLPPRSMS